MKSRWMPFILVGMLFCVATYSFAADNVAEEAALRSELDSLRVGIDELTVLVAELRGAVSASRKEYADLRTQIRQAENTLAGLRRQVAQEEAKLAALQKAPAQGVQAAPAIQPSSSNALSNIEGKTPLDTIFFAANSSALDAYYIPHLNRIGSQMQKAPGMKIVVRGFTTNAGTTAGQDTLSRERAEKTGQYLQKNFGITPDRIALEWVGASKMPVVPNRTMTDKLRRAAQVYTQ